MDILVASSFGGTQWVKARAQGGKPMPWNQPLIIQKNPSAATAELKPKHTFTIADSTRPVTMKVRTLERSPKKPFTNFDTP